MSQMDVSIFLAAFGRVTATRCFCGEGGRGVNMRSLNKFGVIKYTVQLTGWVDTSVYKVSGGLALSRSKLNASLSLE